MKEKNDEIDLSLIYDRIKGGFSWLWDFFASILILIRKRWVLLFLFCLLGAGAGAGLFFITKPVYSSTLVLSSNALTNDFCADVISNLNLLVRDNAPDLLAKELSIPLASAKMIRELRYENYDEKIKTQYKDKDTIVLGIPFKVIAYSSTNTVFDTLQTALVNYLENNEYAIKRKEIKRNNIVLMKNMLQKEIIELDSLKIVVANHLIPRGNATGFVFGQPLDPMNIYKEGAKMFESALTLNETLLLIENIQVRQSFFIRKNPESPRLKRNVATGIAYSFLLGLIIVWSIEKKKISAG